MPFCEVTMTRRLFLVFLLLVLPVGLALSPGCAKHGEVWESKKGERVRVVVSFAPLESFVTAVGGEHVEVICLATTTGPHDFQFNPRDTVSVRHADLLVANGLGLDPFADKLRRNSGNDKLRFVEVGETLPAALLRAADHDEEEEKEGKDHKHGEHDPHVWLGTPQAIKMVEKIRDELKETDPNKQHAADYDRNAKEYVKALEDLRKEGRASLAGKKDVRLISFHDSLRYFADSFGLKIVDVMEEGPGDEPTGKKMKKLVDECLKDKIKYIAVEPQYPKSTSAKVLVEELRKKDKDLEVKLIEIDPLETGEPGELDAGWYVKKMKENLKVLADSLQ